MEKEAGQLLKDNNIEGFLRRAKNGGKSLGLKRKRFYKLDGAIFSKHMTEVKWTLRICRATDGTDISSPNIALTFIF